MRTSMPTLLIEKCAQTIELVIVPALSDASVAEQAWLTAALLRTLAPTIEEKGEEFREENQAMEEVIEEIRNTLRRESLSSNPVAVGLMNVLDPASQRAGDQSTGSSEDNDRLKGVLVQAIRGLDTLRDDLPEETMSSLRKAIHAVLRQQVSNAVARVTGFRPELPPTPVK
jgi:hypothetical protein